MKVFILTMLSLVQLSAFGSLGEDGSTYNEGVICQEELGKGVISPDIDKKKNGKAIKD